MGQPFEVHGTVGIEVTLTTGLVKAARQSLKVDVEGFKYDIGGRRGVYVGVVNQSVTDDDTSYWYIDNNGALQNNTTGFPTTTTHLPLARVVAANGEIVAIHEERVLLASSSSVIDTCEISYPVDGDIKGGTTSASSNNDYAAVRYDAGGEGRNRWNRKPPQNYVSGDLTLRVVYSWSVAPGNNREIVLYWAWSFRSFNDALGSWDGTDQDTIDVSSEVADTLYYQDLTMPAADFEIDANTMHLKFMRRGDLAADDCPQNMYVHEILLRYNGYKVAGQPGQ